MSSNGPAFHEAVNRFRAFLLSEGWPTVIVWVSASKIIRTPGQPITIDAVDADVQATKAYEAAVHNGLGVCFDAICTIGESTCATVLWPADERESELLMYPSGGGLKLSAAVPRTEGRMRQA